MSFIVSCIDSCLSISFKVYINIFSFYVLYKPVCGFLVYFHPSSVRWLWVIVPILILMLFYWFPESFSLGRLACMLLVSFYSFRLPDKGWIVYQREEIFLKIVFSSVVNSAFNSMYGFNQASWLNSVTLWHCILFLILTPDIGLL